MGMRHSFLKMTLSMEGGEKLMLIIRSVGRGTYICLSFKLQVKLSFAINDPRSAHKDY